jgi:nucleoside-diphosphate-sugar epimerase
MIFGDGMIARKLKLSQKFANFHIIARGISNSTENSKVEYERQRDIIMDCISEIKSSAPKCKTIYISSVIHNIDSIYFSEKLLIENLLRQNLDDLCIVRLTNVVGFQQNDSNIFRYFQKQISGGYSLNVNSLAIRNVVDIDDVIEIMEKLAESNFPLSEYVIGHVHNVTACDLARTFEIYYNQVGLINSFEGGISSNGIENPEPHLINHFHGAKARIDYYLNMLLKKYANIDTDIE